MGIDTYLNRITSQHSIQGKYIAWLSSTLNIVQDDVNAANSIIQSFDIDNAVGVQLDVLGDIVGCKRQINFQPSDGSSPVLDDYNYRIILKAKIAMNQWDGTTETIYNIWYSVFPDYTLFLIDNQNMTLTAKVIGVTSIIQQNLVENGYIVPKPSGVSISYQFAEIDNMTMFLGVVVQEGSFETIKQLS